ncbi:MAG: hypothetical protein HF975_04220 [ANME-2 cluster archaeon]|nr:hypothetical protein [ANME-2 cluster archaeon]
MSNNDWQSEQINELTNKYSGAMSGIFDLTKPAEQILGILDPGSVFIYVFRRFGYPHFGWDGDKTLVAYYITTPMDGVVLQVRPDVTGSGTFGYLLNEDQNRACLEEEETPSIEWFGRLNAWSLETHNIKLLRPFEKDEHKIQMIWDIWCENNQDLEVNDVSEAQTIFFDEQYELTEKYTQQYTEIEPLPKTIPLTERPDTSTMKQCHTALCGAINDLKRPVYIRDLLINITGKLPDPSETDNIVEYWPQSGIGVGNK